MRSETTDKYLDHTLALALFDAVPVALFFANGLLIHSRYKSKLFLAGVISAFAGGASKVAWKTVIVTDKKDIDVLTKAFKVLLPAGMTVMMASGAAGLAAAAKKGGMSGLAGSLSPKAAALLASGTAGMGLMAYLGRHMDSSAGSNWIEETVNAVSQAAFLAATTELTSFSEN